MESSYYRDACTHQSHATEEEHAVAAYALEVAREG